MKKAQILSALALAFALGVVAPVANTVVSGETYAADTRAIETATKQDVAGAVAKVEGYSVYKTYAAVLDALDYYNNEKVLDNETKVLKGNTAIAGLKTAISNAVDTLGGTVSDSASLETAIAVAKKTVTVANYNAYSDLYKLVNTDNDKTDLTALKNAINSIDGTPATKNAIKDMAVEEVKAYVNGDWGLHDTYANYVAMIDAVNNAEAVLDFADRMEVALNNVQDWKKTDGETAVDTAADDATDPVAKLVALAVDADDYTTGIEGFDEYETLYNYINDDAENDVTNNESVKNQQIIDNINKFLKAATAVNPGDEVSLDDLKAPATDGTGEGTNKPGDDNTDPNAPDTGILADAEANASTTVAMVAGIATALTAAGAGVVAYRNARRSTRK